MFFAPIFTKSPNPCISSKHSVHSILTLFFKRPLAFPDRRHIAKRNLPRIKIFILLDIFTWVNR